MPLRSTLPAATLPRGGEDRKGRFHSELAACPSSLVGQPCRRRTRARPRRRTDRRYYRPFLSKRRDIEKGEDVVSCGKGEKGASSAYPSTYRVPAPPISRSRDARFWQAINPHVRR